MCLQKERESKKAELQRVDAEVKAWREKEVAKREANNAASIAMRVGILFILCPIQSNTE